MEWMAIIGDSVQYIEDHLTENISAENVAKAVGVLPFYFQNIIRGRLSHGLHDC